MDSYLFVDFGSTFTKLTLVDINREEVAATSKSYTTVDSDVRIGYEKALKALKRKAGKNINIVKSLACSSAAGGLKITAVGLVPELTAEAAKRAALGAGAKVIKTYSYNLNEDEIKEIENSDTNIILLAGGTDGGNTECILHNAKMLADHKLKIPVVAAGNKSCKDEIQKIFEGRVEYYCTENVMPKLNVLNIDPAREIIRTIFMEKITHVKGMENIEEDISEVVMPTPAAVLRAAKILSKGTEEEKGIGDLLVVDVGGATTDIHSAAKGYPTNSAVILRGLEEPFMKRTVEGDLGVRYSTRSLLEAGGERLLISYLKNEDFNIKDEINKRSKKVDFIPENNKELIFDEALAKVCVDLSLKRHVGRIDSVYSPMGMTYYQEGKDLLELPNVIGTGGVLVNSKNPKEILKVGSFKKEDPSFLKPKNPKYLIDKKYIMSSIGLLSCINENMAVRMLKKYIVEV
jgi:uncharacterized protein (TIGR01319 family)